MFFVKNNAPYAIVREFTKLNKNVCQTGELPDPDDAVVLTFVLSGLLGSHFQAVQETERLFKVCVVTFSQGLFLCHWRTMILEFQAVSKVLKSHQHD